LPWYNLKGLSPFISLRLNYAALYNCNLELFVNWYGNKRKRNVSYCNHTDYVRCWTQELWLEDAKSVYSYFPPWFGSLCWSFIKLPGEDSLGWNYAAVWYKKYNLKKKRFGRSKKVKKIHCVSIVMAAAVRAHATAVIRSYTTRPEPDEFFYEITLRKELVCRANYREWSIISKLLCSSSAPVKIFIRRIGAFTISK